MRVVRVDTFQARSAHQTNEFTVGEDLDAWGAFDPIDEVARHRFREPVAANEDGDLRGETAQEHGGLARRIAASDDDHVFLSA